MAHEPQDSQATRIFDPRLVRAHRDRAAARLDEHDFLLREVADRLADRLLDVTRSFPTALDIGCHGGLFARVAGRRGGIETVVGCDPSPGMASRDPDRTVAAEAEALPFAEGRFDLAVSCMSLQWVNDLPGALVQIRRTLKPDGLFLAALPGGGTLGELRAALTEAETEVAGGARPRVSPFVDLRDAGALLQRAGFAMPVVDGEAITVRYANALRLMADLRGMGEANAMVEMPRNVTRRRILLRASEIYQARHAGPDGRIPATFRIVYLTGWAPDASQQKPLRPGSARARLADALGTTESPAGDRTPFSEN